MSRKRIVIQHCKAPIILALPTLVELKKRCQDYEFTIVCSPDTKAIFEFVFADAEFIVRPVFMRPSMLIKILKRISEATAYIGYSRHPIIHVLGYLFKAKIHFNLATKPQQSDIQILDHYATQLEPVITQKALCLDRKSLVPDSLYKDFRADLHRFLSSRNPIILFMVPEQKSISPQVMRSFLDIIQDQDRHTIIFCSEQTQLNLDIPQSMSNIWVYPIPFSKLPIHAKVSLMVSASIYIGPNIQIRQWASILNKPQAILDTKPPYCSEDTHTQYLSAHYEASHIINAIIHLGLYENLPSFESPFKNLQIAYPLNPITKSWGNDLISHRTLPKTHRYWLMILQTTYWLYRHKIQFIHYLPSAPMALKMSVRALKLLGVQTIHILAIPLIPVLDEKDFLKIYHSSHPS